MTELEKERGVGMEHKACKGCVANNDCHHQDNGTLSRCNHVNRQIAKDCHCEELRESIRKARDYQTPMGSSFNDWYEEIQKILQEALEL